MKFTIAILILAGIQQTSGQPPTKQTTIPLVVIYRNGMRSCPSQQQREYAIQTIMDSVVNALGLEPAFQCGAGQWTQIAYLNMTDPSQYSPVHVHPGYYLYTLHVFDVYLTHRYTIITTYCC